LGTSEHAEKDLNTISADRPWLLVLGNEETGIRRLTHNKCDDICRIAPRGAITSLNVSTAAGICIHHLTKFE
jgi:23S rRNA (guanosine2251-2'-O)-methyltransferase